MENSFAQDYLILLIFVLVGSGVLGALLFLSGLIRSSSKSTSDKLMSYECGIIPRGESWIRFRIHYYVFALVFVVLDALFIFLFPWAVILKESGTRVFLAGIAFISLPIIGIIYLIRRKILKWT